MMNARKEKAAFIAAFSLISLFWLFVIINVIKISLPHNSMSGGLDGKSKFIFSSVLPEGFGFFTKNPREFEITLYDSVKNEIDLHNGSWKYMLGVKRYARAFNVEMGHMISVISSQPWHNCETGKIECLDDAQLPQYTLKNNRIEPLMKGTYYLKISDPIPWAWAESFNKESRGMPCKVVKLSIK